MKLSISSFLLFALLSPTMAWLVQWPDMECPKPDDPSCDEDFRDDDSPCAKMMLDLVDPDRVGVKNPVPDELLCLNKLYDKDRKDLRLMKYLKCTDGNGHQIWCLHSACRSVEYAQSGLVTGNDFKTRCVGHMKKHLQTMKTCKKLQGGRYWATCLN